MNDTSKPAVPAWYWVLAVLGLLWNLLGCAAFLIEVFAQEAMMDTMTEPQREWARAIPGWIYGIYAIAVLTGVAGSIGLLLRRAWSVWMFTICFIAVLIQMIYTMLIAGGFQVMGPASLIMPTLVIVLSIALLLFARLARNRRWMV